MLHLKDESLYKDREILTSFIINEEVMSYAHSIDKIVRDNPQKAWKLILKFLREISSDYLFEGFVNGPMRLFLSLHGQNYIKIVEKEARENRLIQKAIKNILRYKSSVNEIDADVLLRLESVSKTESELRMRKSDSKLINSWLIYQSTNWAGRKLDKMIKDDPEKAWPMILELIYQAKDIRSLCYIAAGPLENLLVNHGLKFIERIESKASENKRFRLCLSGVWESRISKKVWSRVQIALGEANIDQWEGAIPGNE